MQFMAYNYFDKVLYKVNRVKNNTRLFIICQLEFCILFSDSLLDQKTKHCILKVWERTNNYINEIIS